MTQGQSVEDSVRGIMASVFNLEASAINESTSSETVEQWDSLGHLSLVSALEEELRIRFTTEEIVSMNSFPSICSVVAKKAG